MENIAPTFSTNMVSSSADDVSLFFSTFFFFLKLWLTANPTVVLATGQPALL